MPRWKQRSKNARKGAPKSSKRNSTKAGSPRSKMFIVPDWKYIGRDNTAKLEGALKYYQYRLDRDWSKDEKFRELCRDRWVDMGLGKNWNQILENCGKLHGQHVEAWTWVINPSPQLMALVPEDQRQEVIRDLTENSIDAYYEARSCPTPEYAYVVHDRLTKPDEQGQQLQDLHTHIVLAGTVVNPFTESRSNFYNNATKGHDVILREVMTTQFEQILDQTIGIEWRSMIQEQEPEQQPQIAYPDSDDLDVWFPRPDPQFAPIVPADIPVIPEQPQQELESLTPELDTNDELNDPSQDDQDDFDLEL